MTSHDVVATVRRLLRIRRVGHAGTLDPLASGVLPVCLGRATRLAEVVGASDKEYEADIRLGLTTTTDDMEGEVVERRDVPPLTRAELDQHLRQFTGIIEQVPPAFSAVKVAGRRAYELARAGQAPALKPRRVTIYQIELLRWDSPVLTVRIRCSRGTYMRSLARDVGRKLGVGGVLARLVRTRVGVFRVEEALTLERLRQAASDGSWRQLVQPPDFVLKDLPAVILPKERAADMREGRPWPASPGDRPVGRARAYSREGEFLGIVELDPRAGRWQPRLSFV